MESAGLSHPITEPIQPEAPAPSQLQENSLPKTEVQPLQKVKRYHRIKLVSGLSLAVLAFTFTLVVLLTGATSALESQLRYWFSNDYAVLLAFAGILGLAEGLLGLPLRFFAGFVLEHRYRLSNQTLKAWFWERIKGMFVGIPLIAILLVVLYYFLRSYGTMWWLPVGITLFFFSVILARLAPILIFPLFYKFEPLGSGPLRERIEELCRQAGVTVRGIFVFNLSKTTKKANAAFTGIGRSKRILLGDTLIANFTDEEIETVFSHELGHYAHRHVWKMLVVGTVSTFAGLGLTALAYDQSLSWFGFSSGASISALPLLGLWLSVYSLITGPLNNMISRRHEWEADAYAVRLSGKKQAFVNALRKLGAVNMADLSPHPLVEFLFHSHPSLEKRIKAAESA